MGTTMHIEFTREGAVATVRLNRPDALNALSEPMKDEMGRLFSELQRDPEVRAVVLCAAGRAFCASGDVTTMGNFTATSAQERLKRAHRVIINLANIEKPVIAAVQGAVAGIGWSMAMACDQIIAGESAYFSQVFKNVGLAPDGGAIYFLTQNLGVLRAKELVLSGRRVKAEEALALGLVSRVVPDAELEQNAKALAEELAQGPTLAFGFGKKMFKHTQTPSLEAFLDAEAWAQGHLLLADDHREGARAFLEKRKPVFKGQ
jgi:2-(1,2-epoxy-1,2-dihydrophenyl)acetyl-CoA isomerase